MPKRVIKKPSKKSLFNGTLLKVATVTSLIVSATLVISTDTDCNEKKKEQSAIQAKIDEYEAENADLRNMLESDDLSEYMERVAIEERGYAYPDERRFYDTSRD